MIRRIRARRTGGSIAATLPREMVARLKVEPGDELFVVETDRGILLTAYDPTFERAMQIYERGAKQYRNALRELAK